MIWSYSYRMRRKQTISRHQIYDTAVEQRRTEEDERYGVILAARGREELKRQMRTAEDAEARKEGERLYDEEQVRVFRLAWTFPGTSAEIVTNSAISIIC